MPLLPLPKIKRFALLPVLAVALFAGVHAKAQDSVQTYTSQAVPSDIPPQYDRYNSPLKAGELTLKDVLSAHPKPKPPTTTAPLLAPAHSSSTNIMLMQGMQSALQQGGGGGPAKLQAPQIGGGGIAGHSTVPIATQAPAPINVGAAPGVEFQPGQEPRNLASGATLQTTAPAAKVSGVKSVTSVSPSAAMPAPTPVPTAPITTVQPSPKSSSGGCEEHSQTWTKTCADAGYPATFTGKITGETRTTCPDGSLQDVWIANSCAPPDGQSSDYAPQPTTTTTASQPASDQEIISTATSESSSAAMAATPSPVPDIAPSVMSRAPVNERTDASCGAANGLASNIKPVVDLCNSGDASDVSGDGPWRWTCKGILGGMTVSCAAPMAQASTASSAPVTHSRSSKAPSNGGTVEDGTCGAADGASTDHAPAADLCAHGVASRVSGNGPWNWACSGSNGGQAAACTAPKKADGMCGSATRMATDQMPTTDLCTAGYASAVTGEGPWNWTCSGLYGGQAAVCSAAPKRDAVCGSASLSGHHEAPMDSLCSVGDASAVHGGGPWSWTCNGTNGGSSVSCNSPVSTNGTCGSSNGVAVLKAPNEGLCSHGTATRVTGTGPWSWNCTGSDGGDSESCTAPLMSRQQREQAEAPAPAAPIVTPPVVQTHTSPTVPEGTATVTPNEAPAEETVATPSTVAAPSADNICGGASELLALAAPEADLCKTGKASSVTGSGPWTWTCTDEGGHTSDCSTLSPSHSSSSAAVSSAKTKSSGPMPSIMTMPKAGKPAPAAEPAAETASEAAPAPVSEVTPTPSDNTAMCGASAGEGANRAPSVELCTVGKPTPLKGSGPWHWTCVKGKSKVSCDAPRIVDGACGIANGSIQKYAPAKGLCSSGVPTEVQGDGPWMWSCVGAAGGASTSCSATSQAQTRVDGACGVASNAPAQSRPDVNLCDSGVPSAVYGEGPWTWTCSGLNGGVAASCASQKNVPAAPPPPGPAVNGLCGSTNGVAATVQPTEDLCTAGTATGVSGEGPWNWNCLGTNGGMTVSCTAPLQPPAPITGACGDASGVPTLTTPRSGLCSAGISSAVSGHGPWTWSCSGTNGGGAVGCVAPLAGTDTGSLPSMTAPSSEAPAPKAAPSGRVIKSGSLSTPKLPSGPLPPLSSSGTMPPSPSFPSAPQPSAMPSAPLLAGSEAPTTAPDLPEGTTPLQPPSLRDNEKTAPALKGDMKNSIPGNRFTLDADISTIAFDRGSENIDTDALPTLDKLAAVLVDHSGARITLTAYADNSGISAREARRLSLTRALAVRDYLVAKGVASSRIDVRALGANTSSGDADRVDVKVN